MSISQTLSDQISVMREVLTMDLLNPASDTTGLDQIDQLMKRRAEERRSSRDSARQSLRNLTRQLDNARLAANRPNTVRTPEEHQENMFQQDNKKFQLANSITELEQSVTKCESTLNKLKDEWSELETVRPAEEHSMDQVVLRLKILRDLGFEIITDDYTGKVNKVLVRNDEANDLNSVVLDKNASAFFHSNYLWKLAGSDSPS
ncbi:hypothetical protein E3P86_00027 [Wallemia ichthyophaga]|uniref:Kinetochore protein Spc24 n=1 Tax=Wallemia ichthyophaga TaxID=245174 RepID=A0A4T0JJ34_WALIC|nr:hypothetical protein E3P86_00027 [Wallemia ichthyophaga]